MEPFNVMRMQIGTGSVPLKEPFVTALRRVDRLELIVVKLEDDEGHTGWGETAATEAITEQGSGTILADLYTIADRIRKQGAWTITQWNAWLKETVPDDPNARSAVEIALYDLAAQRTGLSLVEFLGGKSRSLKTGITISLGATTAMVTSAREALEQGFDALKIKLGDDPLKDLERVAAIADAVAGRASLKLDANQGWSVEETITFLQAIEKEGIAVDLIEQPLPREAIDALAEVRRHTAIPILADESVFSLADARRVLEAGAADCVNIKLDKSGGITEALAIADLCEARGVACMMGCMLEGAVSVGAAAHVAAARPGTITMIDLDAPLLCAEQPVVGGVRFAGAEIEIPDRSGLGVDGIETIQWKERNDRIYSRF